jgi:predicted GIY-YIG superfamily endonuclease
LPSTKEDTVEQHAGEARGKLVYSERFETLAEARRREIEIKQWKSAKMIRALIEGSVG